jgi:transposase
MPAPDTPPDVVATLRAALAAEQLARQEAEARASGAEAMIAHLKLLIAKLRHDRFGASSERGRKLLDQLELELASWSPPPARTPPRRRMPRPRTGRPAARARRPAASRPASPCRSICRASAW